MKLAALVASGLGAAAMLGFVVWKAAPWDWHAGDPGLGPVALTAFVVSPYLPLLLAAALSKTKAAAAVVLALSFVATLLGAASYGDAFLRHESPVYLLIFLGVPALQWLGGLAALVAALVLRGRTPAAVRRSLRPLGITSTPSATPPPHQPGHGG